MSHQDLLVKGGLRFWYWQIWMLFGNFDVCVEVQVVLMFVVFGF